MMFKKSLLIFVSLFSIAFAQYDKDATLFTIAGDQVKVKEFIRVYTKNNINNQADFSKKSLDEYLDLYEKFRLKVMEAETLGMDTAKAFKNELASYRGQLTQSYLSDRKATEKLILEAYDRMKEEVNTSHILIFWPNANPSKEDSAKILKEIKKIKANAEKSGFANQIKMYNKNTKSRYPGNKQKYEGGDLGYVTVFQTVYPFENAIYNTKVGTISEPVATRFGYHLVYVKDKRPARGKMQTAHILVKSKEKDSKENQIKAAEKSLQIYNEIKAKTISFEEAVKKYSEDKKTKYQGGKLPLLSGSEMLQSFSEAAFALKNDGDISTPIKTKIGWHIIKRIKKDEIPAYEYAKNNIQKKVERDSRSNVAKELMINDTKSKFGFSANKYALDELVSAVVTKGNYNLDIKNYSKNLFTIGSKNINQTDFLAFLKMQRSKPKKQVETEIKNSFKIFQNQAITKYREDHLEEIDEDFKNLMQEYHDGILLFELTNKQVWTKAVEDTTGLDNFFKSNRNKYVWKERVSYTTYTATDEKTAKSLKKFLAKGKSKDFILKKLNKKEEKVVVEEKLEEKDANDFVKSLNWTKATISEEKSLDGSVKISYVENILEPSQKELPETRGYVISDYQDFLENNWINNLRKKYNIKLDKKVFNSLVKK